MALQAFIDDFPSSKWYAGGRYHLSRPLCGLIDSLQENLKGKCNEIFCRLPDVLLDLDNFYGDILKRKRITQSASNNKHEVTVSDYDVDQQTILFGHIISGSLNVMACIDPLKNTLRVCGRIEKEKMYRPTRFESHVVRHIVQIPDGIQRKKVKISLSSHADVTIACHRKTAITRNIAIEIIKKVLPDSDTALLPKDCEFTENLSRVYEFKNGKYYSIYIELPSFIPLKPEKVQISILSNKLYIYIQHTVVDDGFSEVYILDTTFNIPNNADKCLMVADMLPNGVLTINAPICWYLDYSKLKVELWHLRQFAFID